MSLLTRILDAADDRLNPIVVKELRQAVQSRFVIVMLLGFLLIDVIAVMSGAISQDLHGGAQSGQNIFFVLNVILLAACIGFLPIYSALRLSSEHGEDGGDLLFITTIRAGAIVRGKFTAAMVLAMTIFGACMPFMTFTYLLRGIDLPTIFFLLVLALGATAESVMFALFLAAMPVGRVVRALLGLVLLGALGTLFSIMVAISGEEVRFGFARNLSDREFWPAMATFAGVALAALGLMYVMTVALLSPRSSNRGMAIRIYLAAVWAAGLAAAIAWGVYIGSGYEDGPGRAWLYLCSVVLGASLFVAVGERDELGPRIRRAIPSSGPLRVLAFPFITGAAGGIAWCALFSAGTLLAGLICHAIFPPHASYYSRDYMGDALVQMFCFLLFCYCYAMTGGLLRRLVFPGSRPGHSQDSMPSFALGIVWAIMITLANAPWLVRQIEQFRPLAPGPREEKGVSAHG
ncbi:MAG: hypothetical protein NTV86_16640 [Planctomycetota bacterium]|nr:hypothetical protein [Planctomycetota bacterium]